MGWEDILKTRSKLSAEEYRILREIVADTIDVYDEFEQYELTDLFLERFREKINEDRPEGVEGKRGYGKAKEKLGSRFRYGNKTQNSRCY